MQVNINASMLIFLVFSLRLVLLLALKLVIYENLVENNIHMWYSLFQLIAYLSLKTQVPKICPAEALLSS
jgi:hypothetical protein